MSYAKCLQSKAEDKKLGLIRQNIKDAGSWIAGQLETNQVHRPTWPT